MASILTKFLKLTNQPDSNARTDKARQWFKDQAQRVKTVDTQKLLAKGRENARSTVVTGQMYLFAYDPKHKNTLPYYDRYPLIFPIKKVPGGILGINMHYLPMPLRAKLMDNLYDLINNDAFDDTTRLKLSYNLLNSAAKFRYFKPCIKHYLNNQIDSRFIYIPPEEWEIALFLPLHRFKNATAAEVYKDSRNKISGR